MADEVNDAVYQGEAKDLVVTVLDENDDPVDLSAATLHYRVARSAQGTALLSLDTAALTVSGDGNNVVTIPRSAVQTKALQAKSLWHELYMIDGDDPTVLMTGRLTVSPAQASQHE